MSDQLTPREQHQVDVLRKLIASYFHISQKHFQDIVIKIIWNNLVKRAQNDLQRELMSELYKEELFHILLQENPNIEIRRTVLRQQIEALSNAESVLSLHSIMPIHHKY